MAITPKASRRPRGTFTSWQPPRTVWGSKEYLRVGGDDPMDRWFGRRRCDGTCVNDKTMLHNCVDIERIRRQHRAYGRRR